MITQKGLAIYLNNYQVNTIEENRNLFLFVREIIVAKIEEICALYGEPLEGILMNYERITSREGKWLYELEFLPEQAVMEINCMIQNYIHESTTAFIMGKKMVNGCTKMNFILTMYQRSRFIINYELFPS